MMNDSEKVNEYEQTLTLIKDYLDMPWTGTYVKERIREEIERLEDNINDL